MSLQKRWAGIKMFCGRMHEHRNARTPHQFVITVLRSLASWTSNDLVFSLFSTTFQHLSPCLLNQSRSSFLPRSATIRSTLKRLVRNGSKSSVSCNLRVIKARNSAEEKEGFIASKALVVAAEPWCQYHTSNSSL